jgi:hypothetical protein
MGEVLVRFKALIFFFGFSKVCFLIRYFCDGLFLYRDIAGYGDLVLVGLDRSE